MVLVGFCLGVDKMIFGFVLFVLFFGVYKEGLVYGCVGFWGRGLLLLCLWMFILGGIFGGGGMIIFVIIYIMKYMKFGWYRGFVIVMIIFYGFCGRLGKV